IASDGWEPMGYWLRKLTGQDPFTLFAPTMTERLTVDEEHPAYRYAVDNHLLSSVSVMKNNATGGYYGTESFDAYVFFPPVSIIHGRPDWLFNTMHRKPVEIPVLLLQNSDSAVLIQAFAAGEPPTAIPVDQIVITKQDMQTRLALPAGRKYWIRAVYAGASASKPIGIVVD
ncbi:MAG: hypothetical protein JO301_07060, partial [Chitinophagaceae bacterium]|nr:hypothetical protein [Chitinophagaceae bacterium]